MQAISYTICAPFAIRKKAMEQLAEEQWARIQKIEDEMEAYNSAYDNAMKDHCEASLYLLGTSRISDTYSFHPSPEAYDHYVRTVREFGYTMMSLVAKQELLAKAQDRYNEIVIQLEDMCAPPRAPPTLLNEDDETDPELTLDDIFAIEPPLTRNRVFKRKAAKKAGKAGKKI